MTEERQSPAGADQTADALLDWYDRHARALPWRSPPGQAADPYRVWLSEIMLQQTTVATVGPYFDRFLKRWPTVSDLAAAPLDDVLGAWAGLGYYARARNLHACARAVVERHDGHFPDCESELLDLPGIGAYTAAAVASIAFERATIAVDGNVERVTARLFAIDAPFPGGKAAVKRAAASLVQPRRPGCYQQALMDLGATVCTPAQPRCMVCPLQAMCAARASGQPAGFPVMAPKKAKPERQGTVYWLTDAAGRVLTRRRAPKGLLGGMPELPSTGWSDGDTGADIATLPIAWGRDHGQIAHTFTHFRLTLDIRAGRLPADSIPAPDGEWLDAAAAAAHGWPTLMRKVVTKVQKGR